MAARDYNFNRHVLIADGQIIGGYHQGAGFVIRWVEDDWEAMTGDDGIVWRSRKGSDLVEVEISLAAVSPSNDVLSAAYYKDRTLGFKFPLMARDYSGRSWVNADQAWVRKMPDFNRQRTAQAVTWMLHATVTDFFIGGSLL